MTCLRSSSMCQKRWNRLVLGAFAVTTTVDRTLGAWLSGPFDWARAREAVRASAIATSATVRDIGCSFHRGGPGHGGGSATYSTRVQCELHDTDAPHVCAATRRAPTPFLLGARLAFPDASGKWQGTNSSRRDGAPRHDVRKVTSPAQRAAVPAGSAGFIPSPPSTRFHVQAEPLIEWSEPVMELIGFIAIFLTAGAIGFRYSSLRGKLARGGATTDASVYETAARRAAMLGLVGSVIAMIRIVRALPNLAQRAHTTTGALLSSNVNAQMMLGFAALALIGFLLASGRLSIGWPLAAIGVVAGTLRGLFSGKWSQLVNPMHELAAGLWIGTLFVMVIVGLALVLRNETPADRRGPIAAGMINDFSPLALTC